MAGGGIPEPTLRISSILTGDTAHARQLIVRGLKCHGRTLTCYSIFGRELLCSRCLESGIDGAGIVEG